MSTDQKTRRGWFTFSLREAALAILALGAFFAWFVERRSRDNDVQLNFPVTKAIDALKSQPKAHEAITGAKVDGRIVVVYAYPSAEIYKAVAAKAEEWGERQRGYYDIQDINLGLMSTMEYHDLKTPHNASTP